MVCVCVFARACRAAKIHQYMENDQFLKEKLWLFALNYQIYFSFIVFNLSHYFI